MKHLLIPFVLAVSLILGSGCNKETEKEDLTQVVKASPPKLTVLETGAAPKRLLRYKPKAGTSEALNIIMDMDTTMAGQPKVDLPPMKISGRAQVVEVRPNGDIKYTFKFTHSDVLDDGENPAVARVMRAKLKESTNISGWALVDASGATKEGDMNLSQITDPAAKQQMQSMKNQMEQMSAPMPAVPVGVGAKWTLEQTIKQHGMGIIQTAHYEVVSIVGDKVQLAIRITQTAPRQSFNPPNLPPGARATVDHVNSTGSGKMLVDLNHLIPESTLNLEMDMKISVSLGSDSQSLKMKISLGMQITSKD
jgi:hypothetical protein